MVELVYLIKLWLWLWLWLPTYA